MIDHRFRSGCCPPGTGSPAVASSTTVRRSPGRRNEHRRVPRGAARHTVVTAVGNVNRSCHRCWISNRPSSCWRSSRRSTSATIQLARRRLAKQWHPDIAPPGKQLEHERHLKAINEAADTLEAMAEESRGGRVTKNAVKVSAAAARKRRAEEGARAYAEEQRQRAQDADRAEARPVRLARPRPLGRPPLRPLPLLSRVGGGQRPRASTSPATGTTSSSGRACPSSPASAPSRRAPCSSWTSRGPTPAPTACSAS